MTTQTTRNLGREVAEALVSVGKLKRETMQEGYYNDLIDHGILVNFSRDIWITILDGDEVLSEMYPDYPNDLNACSRDLTREGYQVGLMESADQWLAYYVIGSSDMGRYGTHIRETHSLASTPAVAWCEAFLALCKYIETKGEG